MICAQPVRASTPSRHRRYSTPALERLTNEELATHIAAKHPQATTMEDILVTRNRPLIWSVAARYQRGSMELDDLAAHAMDGLLHAARRFDPRRGCVFSTSAVVWMRQRIQRATQNDGTVRIPAYLHDLLPKVKEVIGVIGDDPTLIASHLGVTVDAVVRALHSERMLRLGEMDAPLSVSTAYGDGIVDRSEAIGAGDFADSTALRIAFERWVSSLSERDARIVVLRLKGKSYRTISTQVGLHRNDIPVLLRDMASRSEFLGEMV